MIKLENLTGKKIFFVGIGGISMSSLVHFCLREGAIVSGSDATINDQIRKLSKFGITIFTGHTKHNITQNIDMVVYSGAIKEDNPELVEARTHNIPCIERSQLLGVICNMYSNSIAVSGTHGKTTTTAMIANIFAVAECKPSVHLGGESIDFGNYLLGGKDVFITEGCEYRNSIAHLNPTTAVVTNIELDHTDFYHSLEEIENAFLNFANNAIKNVVVFENNEFAKKITGNVEVVTVGFNGDYAVQGKNLTTFSDGKCAFDVYYNGNYICNFKVGIVGAHNANNALCAIAVGLINEISISDIYKAISSFKGVKRRYENIGKMGKIPVICDYAHHPTEIEKSIQCEKNIYGRVAVVFQPHTYSRTIGLKDKFVEVLSKCDQLIMFKTYPAREKYITGGSAKELYNDIKIKNKVYCDTKKALKIALSNVKANCILVLGAGDIYDIMRNIIKE